MRGKVKGCGFLALAVRITPAYAGKRGSGSLPRSCRRDHPRVCGEKVLLYSGLLYPLGSPPRVRGKAVLGGLPSRNVGITPACAGKRKMLLNELHSTWDHPRVCGEKSIREILLISLKGSPPRVRGKGNESAVGLVVQRITPAYAGKSVRRENSSS